MSMCACVCVYPLNKDLGFKDQLLQGGCVAAFVAASRGRVGIKHEEHKRGRHDGHSHNDGYRRDAILWIVAMCGRN